ncbi:integrase catalytic domain-containing protein [Nephila pilipes]|uniref:Integrase catalytic domain-containing protein n=1 Tax=Nephila pilipes TaxID=299642 RepID=A0A8X6P6Q1_NEPPI|nr:integrase catalytic domain-containing protein [Nephila pilipes]
MRGHSADNLEDTVCHFDVELTSRKVDVNITLFKFYVMKWGKSIEHISITTDVPHGNDQVEFIHGTISPVLTKLGTNEPDKWFMYVPRLQRILNSTTTLNTKFPHFELLIGVRMKQQEDLHIKQLLDEEHQQRTLDEKDVLR